MLVAVTLAGSIWAWNGDTGNVIWSRTGTTLGGSQNYLWFDDCGPASGGGTSVSDFAATGGLPFVGIASTPVIDPYVTPPVMYVTSFCQIGTTFSATNDQWWIHQINLTTGADNVTHQQITATVAGSGGADDLFTTSPPCPSTGPNPCIQFTGWETLQRSALLEVNVAGASPGTLIYVAFGNALAEKGNRYHGWIFAYDASLNQQVAFVTTAQGDSSNNNTPACITGCSCGSGLGSCTHGCITSGYLFSKNWCGHAGGSWMHGRGPAAAHDSSGASHAYFGIGNGSFQQWEEDGTTLLSSIQNWSDTIIDLTLATSGNYQSPSEYFTPYGGVAVQPPTGTIGGTAYTFAGLNEDDFDMATCGILLFTDLGGTPRLVTCDKSGYGYLLSQGNLCGSAPCYPGTSSTPSGTPGFASGDPGNIFPFQASATTCPDKESNDMTCHRFTSLAFYNNGSPPRLYFWPYKETLTSLELSNDSSQSGTGELTWSGSSTTFTLTGSCTSGTNCLSDQVIPGDILTIPACTCGTVGSACPIITAVTTTSLTVNNNNFTGCTGPQAFAYSGYFINPVHDKHPMGSGVQYPGGSLWITSDGGSPAVVWALATIDSSNPQGTLLAYDAPTLTLRWCSNTYSYCDSSSAFTLTNQNGSSNFALPTVVNGYAYVPTSGITAAQECTAPGSCTTNTTCTSSSPCSGLIVYSGHYTGP
jgi:hypothetical protein